MQEQAQTCEEVVCSASLRASSPKGLSGRTSTAAAALHTSNGVMAHVGQPEDIASLRLECIRWESAAVESRAGEEDAKYETHLKQLQVQELRDRLAVFDPIVVEERNRALRLKIQRLQDEILELREGKYEDAERLQHHAFQIRAHMEAEYRRKVRENEARLTEQLRAELPAAAQQALVDRESLRKELAALQESIGAVTSRSRVAETRQAASSVSASVSRSLASEQAKATVQLRKRCEVAEAKQLDAERKLAEALRSIGEVRGNSDAQPQSAEGVCCDGVATRPPFRSVDSRVHASGSRVRPSSAHPPLQVPRLEDGDGRRGTTQVDSTLEEAKRREQQVVPRSGRGVDVAVALIEVQQSEAKWKRRAKLLQETNAKLEAILQHKADALAMIPAALDQSDGRTKQTRERRPQTARPMSRPFF